MPFFDAECITNSQRQGHSFYKMRKETIPKLSNGVMSNDLSDPNLDFKVATLFNVKQLENNTRQS